MKHKIMFLLPRLAGFTLLIGLASLVLFLLFKLLLLAIVIGVIVAVTAKIVSGVRARWAAGNSSLWSQQAPVGVAGNNSSMHPVMHRQAQTPAIVPIH
ncbi:hypothetical protein [Niabella aurantiaca]|uniref:hypothetical protein n=1 Tax=Niabella aurantiaca TaxID=379900 RepID=UPI000366A3FD|nr:hypothetical protein [Niabella aurantiaca]